MGPGFHTEYMLLCVCDQQVNQDFLLLFGAETASKMLEKWDTSFKLKFIKEAKQLTPTTELCRLLKASKVNYTAYIVHITNLLAIFIFSY